ncbi:MAG: hypothetical protein RR539_06465 [Clostridium sp.]|uniref:hypothetical protein n=1 Tax=Clostridium sp. TaxID=1506 RepID=UPI002FC81072
MSFSNFLSTTKGRVTTIAILSIIIISGLIYYLMYGSIDAKYTRQSKKTISLIESSISNVTSTYGLLTGDLNNIDKIISNLKSSKKDIEKAINITKNTNVPDKYKKSHSNITQGLQNNNLLYTQTIAALENYSSTTVNESINKLYEYVSLTIGYYESYKTDNLTITVPKEFANYPDKFKSYIETLNALDDSIKSKEENNTYIASLRESLTQVTNIKTLIDDDINLVNEGTLNSKQLMVNISKHKNTLSLVIDSVNTLSTPSSLTELKTSFITCAVSYEDYLSALRSGLESSTEVDGKAALKGALNASADKLQVFESNYTKLEESLKQKQQK